MTEVEALRDALLGMREWHRRYHGEARCLLCIRADDALYGEPADTRPAGPPVFSEAERTLIDDVIARLARERSTQG